MVRTQQIAEEFGFGTKLRGICFSEFSRILLTKGLRATSASTRLSPLDAIYPAQYFGIAEAMPFQSW